MKTSKMKYIYVLIFFILFPLMLVGSLLIIERNHLLDTLKKSSYQIEGNLPKDYHNRFNSENGIDLVEYRGLISEIKKYCIATDIDVFFILQVKDEKLINSIKLPLSLSEKMDPYKETYMLEETDKAILNLSHKLIFHNDINSNSNGIYHYNNTKYIVNLIFNKDYFGNRYLIVAGRSLNSFLSNGFEKSFLTFFIVLFILILNALGIFIVMKINKEKELLSVKDELTGFYTRKYLSVIEKTIKTSNNQGWGIIYCDIDGLKKINDTLGHHKGDEHIVNFSRILKSSFRSDEDFIFRMGGDEFLVISMINNEEYFTLLTNRLKNKSNRNLMFSIGFTYISKSETTSFSLDNSIADVDKQMYENKDKQKSSRDVFSQIYNN